MTDARIRNGRNFNFFKRKTITFTSTSEFGDMSDGYQPDFIIDFPCQSVIMINESTSGVLEFSLNGFYVAGELDPSNLSKGMVFDNRSMNKIWFRVKQGSTGPISVRVEAWAKE